MISDAKIERAVLKYLQDWERDPTGPMGPAPVLFPDILAHFEFLECSDAEIQSLNSRRLEAKFDELLTRGLIEGEHWKNGWGNQRITESGRRTLIELDRSQSWSNQLKIVTRAFWALLLFCFSALLILLLEVISPAKYCPKIHTNLAEWLAPCAAIMDANQ